MGPIFKGQDGVDWLSSNVSKELPFYAPKNPEESSSHLSRRKPEITHKNDDFDIK
jgi:F420-0:gamma-glutamyl ligase